MKKSAVISCLAVLGLSASADGKSFFELKPVDETCKVWSGEMPIPQSGLKRDKKGHLPRPFVKVTVLGGQIDRPLLTWLDRQS